MYIIKSESSDVWKKVYHHSWAIGLGKVAQNLIKSENTMLSSFYVLKHQYFYTSKYIMLIFMLSLNVNIKKVG